MSRTTPPGFYGKLPSVGDFVRRRLPDVFVDPWHVAMQRLLLASLRGNETGGLPAPRWRFSLAPGMCGKGAWTGVMALSRDRVGREFPMVIAAPEHPPGLEAVPASTGIPEWLEDAEALLRDHVTDAQGDVERLDRACLALMHRPAMPLAPRGPGAATIGSLWWTATDGDSPGAWMTVDGWPNARHAQALLGTPAQEASASLERA